MLLSLAPTSGLTELAMRQRGTQIARTAAWLAVALCVASYTVFSTTPSSAALMKSSIPPLEVSTRHLSDQMLAWCGDKGPNKDHVSCAYRFWTWAAPQLGAIKSYDLVLQARIDDKQFSAECHHSMHAIGQYAFKELGSYTALKVGSELCQGGYQHGVVQQWTASGTGIEEIPTLCDPVVDTASHARAICGHGLGHALALRMPESMTLALQTCERIMADDLKSPCVAGAVMEFSGRDHVTDGVQKLTGNVPSSYVTADDRVDACEVLTTAIVRNVCWKWLHYMWDEDVSSDPSTYENFCRKASHQADHDTCMSTWAEWAAFHLGINTVSDPKIAEKTSVGFVGCEKLSSRENDVRVCQSLIVALIWQDEPLSSETKSFCKDVAVKFQETCKLGFEDGERRRTAA